MLLDCCLRKRLTSGGFLLLVGDYCAGLVYFTLRRKKMKYVLVTGGVVSGLGKGVTASSIGVLLKACGLRVTSIKIGNFYFYFSVTLLWFESDDVFAYGTLNLLDPYLNTDAGTMSPFEHGEVFVLDDGGEVNIYHFFFFVTF